MRPIAFLILFYSQKPGELYSVLQKEGRILGCPFSSLTSFLLLPIFLFINLNLSQAQSRKKSQSLETESLVFSNLTDTEQGFYKKYYTEKDGLSNRSCFDVYKDSRGYLWITTGDGLNRYDGEEFIVYKYSTLDSNTVDWNKTYFVTEDKYGKIWVAGDHRKSNIFDPETGVFTTFDRKKQFFEPREDALTIPKTFAFSIPELIRYDSLYPTKNEAAKTGIARHAGGMGGGNGDDDFILFKHKDQWFFWRMCNIGTGMGYCTFNIDEVIWDHFLIEEKLQSGTGYFWYPRANSSEGNLLDSAYVNYSAAGRIRVDNRRNLWFLNTEDLSLNRLGVKTKELTNFGTSIDVDFSVYQDDEGSIWLTGKSGLTKIDPTDDSFKSIDIEFQAINMVQLKDGFIYANSGNHLIRIDPASLKSEQIFFNKEVPYYGFYKNPRIFNISTQDGNSLWNTHLDWPVGVSRFDPKIDEFFSYHKKNYPTQTMLWINDREFWLDMYDGDEYNFDGKGTHIFNIDSLKYREQPPSFENLYYQYAVKDSLQNCVWAFQDYHVIKIEISSKEVDTLDLPGRTWNEIHHLYVEGNNLWAATDLGLVNIHTSTHKIKDLITTDDGLPSNNIRSIIKAGDVLCLGTQNGLSLYNPLTKEVRNYFEEDGLTHNEFQARSIFKDKEGFVWMGALDRINVFSPDSLLAKISKKKPLVFTRQNVYNVESDSTSGEILFSREKERTLTLQPTDQSFTLRFALLSYKNSDKNQYSWYLEGYEPAWRNKSLDPVANYQNLSPGSYTLHIKAFDHRGTPALNPLILTVDVLQVWYKRWWALLIYALLLATGIYFFYRYQLKRKLEFEESRRLKELDSLKTRLYTNITHEFRTPLTVILGMAQQVQDYLLNNEQEKIKYSASLIERNGRNLLQLVNQLLDLSKLESGKMSLDLIQGNIVVFIRYLTESFHSLAESKNIELTFSSETEEVVMDYSPDSMQQILSNLLSNAIKFTPMGGRVRLQLSTENGTMKDESGLVLEVKDTGVGIEDEKLPYIFDRFYQVDGTHTRKEEGTGIGLSLVKELVKLMNGEIEVKSKSETGTTFRVRIPISKNPSTPLQDAVRPDKKSLPTSLFSEPPLSIHSSLPGKVLFEDKERPILLIVEDNEDVAQYIHSCLEHEYQILHARNGRIGVEMAYENIPDVMISDVMMPEVDGFELLKILKNDERTSHIPIIMLTAKADIDSKLIGLERGADAYLAKPFDKAELQIRMQRLIELRRKLQARYSKGIQELPPIDKADIATQKEDAFLIKTQDIILAHLSEPNFDTAALCKEIGMSKTQLYRKLKALTNRSIAIYIRSVRLQKGKELLRNPDLSVSEIAYDVGFSDPAYFSRSFTEEFGEAPSTFRA